MSKHKNNKYFYWVTAVSVLSLTGSHSPLHFSRMPSNTVLISGPAVSAAQILIRSYSFVFLPSNCTAIRTSEFSFVGTFSDLLYIPQTQNLLSSLCGFNLQLYSWWEGFVSSSLVTLPLGFNHDFISTSRYGLSTGVWFWGCPGGLGFAPVKVRGRGSVAAWATGILGVPATQGSWQLGQQEI